MKLVNLEMGIGIDIDWVKVFGAAFATYAIKKDGSLWAWGSNYFITLGDGTNIDRLSPIRLGLANDWQTLKSGINEIKHTLAIKQDSTLWGWGNNSGGQLGDGKANFKNPLYYNSPTLISDKKDWLSVSCGYSHSVALRSTSSFVLNSSALLLDTSFILKERACIPLVFHFNKITPAQQKKGTFTVSLAYNSLALRYLDGLPSQYKVSTTITNNRETLTITSDTVIFTGKDTINLNLCFNTFLADSLKNVISITNFDFTGKNNVITRDGTIEFLGCKIDLRKVEFNPITFEMSPNPVKDKLTINYKGYDDNELITIMNIVGATLIETTINESMDVSNLSSGLYFLKIRNQVYKFVKE
ncbi:MAG: T9SS type A sorting domain-containing protein [Candidatus Kapabacteria bacterium]|nr:T9SS type A sorting domain-containing protein [Candidatus Kapabacteria bacterium]